MDELTTVQYTAEAGSGLLLVRNQAMDFLARWHLCDGMLGGFSPSLVPHPVASTKGSWMIGLISCFTMTYKSRRTVQRVWLGLDPGALGYSTPAQATGW